MNIVFSTAISQKYHTQLRENHPDVTFFFCDSMEEAKQYLSEAEVLVTFGVDVTEEIIDMAERLKWIMVISAGMDEMPLDAIEKKGITVTNVRGIHKVPMAEYVISMLMQVYRKEKTLIHNEDEHHWNKSIQMEEISGRTMLVVGTGAIGQEVARLAMAFNMTTIGVSRSGRSVEYFDETHTSDNLTQLLHQADFVISVMPSTPQTRYMFTADHFRSMSDNAVFLNIGRGDVVSEDILLGAVQSGEIAHAVLDVFETEPLADNHSFWKEDNITITPHLSGVSTQYVPRALSVFERNLHLYKQQDGELINQVNLSRGY